MHLIKVKLKAGFILTFQNVEAKSLKIYIIKITEIDISVVVSVHLETIIWLLQFH